jgi:hypothetical protein
VAATLAAFLLCAGQRQMVKVIDIPEDDAGVGKAFDNFCDLYDIAVMDRAEILQIYRESGAGYALRRWYQMQAECKNFGI